MQRSFLGWLVNVVRREKKRVEGQGAAAGVRLEGSDRIHHILRECVN